MKELQYKDNIIEYKIIRKNIKNLYIRIKEGAVIITAPKTLKDKDIESFITKKSEWIYERLNENKTKKERTNQYEKDEFINIIEENAKELIKKTGLRPNKIRIRDIKYAWGSCSSNKNITINAKLIQYDELAIRYVILHELCHLKYMNHSKGFWNLVGRYMPEYKEVQKSLK